MNVALKSVAFLCLCLTLFGCAHAQFDTPHEFAKLDEKSSYAQRVTSARGIVIAVREIDAPEDTSIAFWSEAISLRLNSGQGYALLGEQDVKAKSGQAGKLMRFGHDQNGHTFDYWVAVFPQKKRVVLVEAGGRRDHFEKAKPEVEKALASLTLH
jgi:hypothetical protein